MFISALIKKKKRAYTALAALPFLKSYVCAGGNYFRFAAREEGENYFCFVAGAVEENKGIKGSESLA